jgi:endonuclease III
MGTKPAKRKVGRAGQKVRAKPGSKATPEQAAAVAKGLAKEYADAECALTHKNAFQLLVATILSAQCTDQRVNMVTPELFKKWPTPEDLAQADVRELEKVIQSTGFFRNKAKNILGCCQKLVEEHGGEVPRTLEELVKLPGIGRKTANVVLGTAYGIPSGVVVDTHVTRLCFRLGLTKHSNAVKIEQDLIKLLPEKEWIDFSHRLIHHGRRICNARKPLCGKCMLLEVCPRIGVEEKMPAG